MQEHELSMPSKEPLDDRCAIRVRNGNGYCENYPVDGASTCRMHGGTGGAPEGNTNAVGNAGGDGAPEGNTRALKHGVRADPWNLYESLDDTEQQWIDDLAAGYRDLLGLDEHDARSDRVKRACIHIFQAWRGEELIVDEGMSTETVIAETDDGPVSKKEAHHLHRYMLERDREVRQILSDLGAFNQN